MDLSLEIASLNYELELKTCHIPGVDNTWADALSRLEEPGSGAQVPPELTSVPRATARVRADSWWIPRGDMAPPAELDWIVRVSTAVTEEAKGAAGSTCPQPFQVRSSSSPSTT